MGAIFMPGIWGLVIIILVINMVCVTPPQNQNYTPAETTTSFICDEMILVSW
jgi:hypothetical protein